MARFSPLSAVALCVFAGCSSSPLPPPISSDLFALANRCVSLEASAPNRDHGALLASAQAGATFAFSRKELGEASRFFMRATDLGTYLLRDEQGRYVFGSQDGSLTRVETLESDVTRNEDGYIGCGSDPAQPSSVEETATRKMETG